MNLQEYLDQRVSEPDASVFTNVKYDKQETTVRIGGRSCPQEQVWADLSATREKKKRICVFNNVFTSVPLASEYQNTVKSAIIGFDAFTFALFSLIS